MPINHFMNRALPAFRNSVDVTTFNQMISGVDITDCFFLFVQNDREQMKNYLETLAIVGNLRRVNNQIAKQIRTRLHLRSLRTRNTEPQSTIIQGFTRLTL